jgi:MoxR-like ATPase
LATSKPIEQERTNLEAQVDRFMLKTVIDYPKWMKMYGCSSKLKRKLRESKPVVSVEQILRAQKRFCESMDEEN